MIIYYYYLFGGIDYILFLIVMCFEMLGGSAQSVPLLHCLLRPVDHVHPVLKLWALSVHEGS